MRVVSGQTNYGNTPMLQTALRINLDMILPNFALPFLNDPPKFSMSAKLDHSSIKSVWFREFFVVTENKLSANRHDKEYIRSAYCTGHPISDWRRE